MTRTNMGASVSGILFQLRGGAADKENLKPTPSMPPKFASLAPNATIFPECAQQPTLHIAAGCDYSAYASEHRVYVFGAVIDGQACTPAGEVSYSKPKLAAKFDEPIVQLLAAKNSIFVLTQSGAVYGWGSNRKSQLGFKEQENFRTPAKLTLLDEFSSIKKLVAGSYSGLALTKAGQVYEWGDVDKRLNDNTGYCYRELAMPAVKDLVAGHVHSLALTEDGDVYSWGLNHHGQLGDGNTDSFRDAEPVNIGEPVDRIYAGGLQSMAITLSGKVYVWGDNEYKQLASEQPEMISAPQLLNFKGLPFDGSQIKQCVLSSVNMLILTESGDVYSCGANVHGQLGRSLSDDCDSALKKIDFPDGKKVERLVAGDSHFFAQTTSGKFFGWGSNRQGQLGLGYAGNCQKKPVAIDSLMPQAESVAVSADEAKESVMTYGFG